MEHLFTLHNMFSLCPTQMINYKVQVRVTVKSPSTFMNSLGNNVQTESFCVFVPFSFFYFFCLMSIFKSFVSELLHHEADRGRKEIVPLSQLRWKEMWMIASSNKTVQ